MKQIVDNKNQQVVMPEPALSEWQRVLDSGAITVKEFSKRFRKAIKEAYKNRQA